jgi:beta-glucosidase
MRWPEGFWWGTGASSAQTEGASPASDWWDWEQAGRVPISGSGNGFATRFAEDFALLADLGLTHHRLSIDWARIEPEEGRRDEAAVEHYRAVLSSARDAGIEPWVTLHHFVLPRWVAQRGGFLHEPNRSVAWARHVDFMADTYGDLVYGWKPVNEFNIFPLLAYRLGSIPPGHQDTGEWATATEAVHLATAEAGARLRETGKPVCAIFNLAGIVVLDDDPESRRQADRMHNTGYDLGLDLLREGRLAVPGRDPIERPDLVGWADLVGFSYYFTFAFGEGRLQTYPAGARTSPLGYGIHAEGVGLVLDELHRLAPELPIVVAEYGIGTDDDEERAAYLRSGLATVHDAIERGIDVRGFFHWTAVDNYEWTHGYDVRFGIIDGDRNVRPSADVLRAEAAPDRT